MAEEKREPVEYIVLEKSLVGNEIFEAGATVKYDGLPAENLKPTCAVGEARYQEYLASNAERVAKLKEQYADAPGGGVGDPEKFAAAVRKAIAEANAEAAANLSTTVAEAVAAAIAKVFPNGTNKKAVDPAAEGSQIA